MTMIAYGVAFWLFLAGMYGLCTTRNYLHATACLNVVQSATYVLLLGVGYRAGARAPVFKGVPHDAPAVDPVVQALTLTDIVVGAAVTALILSLAVQAAKRKGSIDPREFRPLQG
jgi:multicomponent Na+:H+ antiporter subunit C